MSAFQFIWCDLILAGDWYSAVILCTLHGSHGKIINQLKPPVGKIQKTDTCVHYNPLNWPVTCCTLHYKCVFIPAMDCRGAC